MQAVNSNQNQTVAEFNGVFSAERKIKQKFMSHPISHDFEFDPRCNAILLAKFKFKF